MVYLSDLMNRLCFLALILPILVATAENSTERSTSANGRKQDYKKPVDDLVCRPFGECGPCPEDEIYQPYCHPYGNRRLVHCIPHTDGDDPSGDGAYGQEDGYFSTHADAKAAHAKGKSGSGGVPHLQTAEGEDQDGVKVYITSWSGKTISWSDVQGEVPAWESCGKVIAKETESYWRFVTFNTLILILSIVVLLIRANKLAAIQYRELAARIGIVRGG
ncbi:hypothetical protein QFC20_004661 [Naganishia adeliensis]|uniref:Uncharacterized protein n=1 Tax=Naganishia adeliensis TaxID=92952 RepID=A0ACC2VYN7_9TREE|nr:hypothetical protein QFC20_004661 [Naganishia adeliensis]